MDISSFDYGLGSDLFWAVLGVGTTVLAFVVYRWLIFGYRIKNHFQLPIYSILIGTDLIEKGKPFRLGNRKVVGQPDALIFNLLAWSLIVCEYKSRVNNSGRVTDYERYQVITYLGLAKRFWCWRVKGIVLYGKSTLVEVHFDKSMYKRLLGLVAEVKRSKRDWYPVNRTPLKNR